MSSTTNSVSDQSGDAGARPTWRLWCEFVALFVGAPLLITATFGALPLLPIIAAFAGLSCILLQITPGWRWKYLLRGPVLGEWRVLAIYSIVTLAVSLAIVFALIPHRFLELPTHRTALWLMIMVLYPVFSAFPQEIIFRTLFFERYGRLFPNAAIAIAMNGAAFALGHLFFDNWVTISMTGFGGAIMGWAYLRHRAIGLPWLLHSIAGQIIFTVGLGVYFYHGAIGATP